MTEFERIMESMMQQNRIKAAEKKKAQEIEAEMLNKRRKISATMASKVSVALNKFKIVVSERLELEVEKLKEKCLLLETFKERYDLLSQEKEQAVLRIQANKLHRRFEDQSIKNTASDTMWSLYAQLHISDLPYVADYQTARELYCLLSKEIGKVGDELGFSKHQSLLGKHVEYEVQSVDATQSSRSGNEQVDETLMVTAAKKHTSQEAVGTKRKRGRPSNVTSRSFAELFPEQGQADLLMQLLISHNFVNSDGSWKGSKSGLAVLLWVLWDHGIFMAINDRLIAIRAFMAHFNIEATDNLFYNYPKTKKLLDLYDKIRDLVINELKSWIISVN